MRYILIFMIICVFCIGKESLIYQEFLKEYEILNGQNLERKFGLKNEKICLQEENMEIDKIIGIVDRKIYYFCTSKEKIQINSLKDGKIEKIKEINKKNWLDKIEQAKVTRDFLVYEFSSIKNETNKSRSYIVEKINFKNKETEIIGESRAYFFKNNLPHEVFYLKSRYGDDIYNINLLGIKKIDVSNLEIENLFAIVYIDDEIVIGMEAEVINEGKKSWKTITRNIYKYNIKGEKSIIYRANFNISSIYLTDDKKYLFIEDTEKKETILKKQAVKTDLYIMKLETGDIEKIKDKKFVYDYYTSQDDRFFLMKK